jgi:carbonic anhydrase
MALERLLKGFADFRMGYYREHPDLFKRLATEGQSPKILIIGCADSRVDPGILTQTRPGDIFTVRNIGAMVPPAQPDERQHGTSSAIEYAIRGLDVEHVVVLGHALCGGVAALVDAERSSAYASWDYLSTWTAVARDVRNIAMRELKDQPREALVRAIEHASVLNSVANLMTFPWLAERVEAGKLVIHGWWFTLVEGQLYAFNPTTARFDPVEGVEVTPTITKDTSLMSIRPERLIAVAAGKPGF